ncbi:serine hydrolase, partial [Staphylococcus aureus]|nr:serine hydrolase [Staphylococcus aureus]
SRHRKSPVAHDFTAKLTAHKVYWVASVTKLVTSIAALQLVEAGKVSHDEPLGKIAPELEARDLLVKTSETDFELTKAR